MYRTNRSKSRDPLQQNSQQNSEQECPGGICDKVTTMGASALQGIGKGIGNAFQSIKSRVYPLPPKPAVLEPPKPLTEEEKLILRHALVHHFNVKSRRDLTDPTNKRKIVEEPDKNYARKIYSALDLAYQREAGPIDQRDYRLIKDTLEHDLNKEDDVEKIVCSPVEKNAIKRAIEIIDYKIKEQKKTNGGKSKRSKKHSKKHSKQSKRKGHKGTRKH